MRRSCFLVFITLVGRLPLSLVNKLPMGVHLSLKSQKLGLDSKQVRGLATWEWQILLLFNFLQSLIMDTSLFEIRVNMMISCHMLFNIVSKGWLDGLKRLKFILLWRWGDWIKGRARNTLKVRPVQLLLLKQGPKTSLINLRAFCRVILHANIAIWNLQRLVIAAWCNLHVRLLNTLHWYVSIAKIRKTC